MGNLVTLTKFCAIPELFVIPVPLMVKRGEAVSVIVNALAPASNTMAFTSVLAETEMAVVFETAKVAVSDAPFVTLAGVQFAAVFQSPLTGLRFHVALPA